MAYGRGPYGRGPYGVGPNWRPELPEDLGEKLTELAAHANLSISALIIPERKVASGILLRTTSALWAEVVKALSEDWSLAFKLPPDKWEEIVAGAFKRAGYDDVVLTPRSGDRGRDVIATRHGVGCVKIIGSVKRYKPTRLVKYDDVRALLGVMSGEPNVSKAIITTTSDFPTRIESDPGIAPFLPTRLELMNGEKLRQWLGDLIRGG